MGEWANPNDFSTALKLTNVQYAHEFIDDGTIKFNTPQLWIEYYQTHGNGRGDIYEGTLAFCGVLDFIRTTELMNEYNNPIVLNAKNRPIVTQRINQRLVFKDKRSLQLPCFCIYLLKYSLFACPNGPGKQSLSAKIPASFFRDFSDNKCPENIKKLDKENQPALILIKDFPEFMRRLREALKIIGINDSEIMFGRMSYYDFEQYKQDGWIDFNQKYPMELLIKNSCFANQSEGRVILKTENEDAKKYLNDNTIHLGPMSDIAQIVEIYSCEGLEVEATFDICEV